MDFVEIDDEVNFEHLQWILNATINDKLSLKIDGRINDDWNEQVSIFENLEKNVLFFIFHGPQIFQ